LQIDSAGQVALKLKTAWRDGTTHIVMSLVVPQAPGQVTGKSELTATESGCTHSRPARISWARLLKRVLQIDIEHCPNCGGQLKIIAAIMEAPGTGADPHAPGAAGPGTAPGAGARRF